MNGQTVYLWTKLKRTNREHRGLTSWCLQAINGKTVCGQAKSEEDEGKGEEVNADAGENGASERTDASAISVSTNIRLLGGALSQI